MDKRPWLLQSPFFERLGEAPYGQESGLMGVLNGLARSGLPVPEGLVLTGDAHEEFLRTSGLMSSIRQARDGGRSHVRRHARTLRTGSLGETLDYLFCEALIDLGARTVRVLWQGGACCDLRSIPEVREAVQDAWLCPRGLERQILASLRGEAIPMWPVLIQREVRPEYTGWASSATGKPGVLHDVRPAGQKDQEGWSIPELTVEAASVLGKPVRLEWGLEGGQWYVLTVQ